jgi:hypothetical protein
MPAATALQFALVSATMSCGVAYERTLDAPGPGRRPLGDMTLDGGAAAIERATPPAPALAPAPAPARVARRAPETLETRPTAPQTPPPPPQRLIEARSARQRSGPPGCPSRAESGRPSPTRTHAVHRAPLHTGAGEHSQGCNARLRSWPRTLHNAERMEIAARHIDHRASRERRAHQRRLQDLPCVSEATLAVVVLAKRVQAAIACDVLRKGACNARGFVRERTREHCRVRTARRDMHGLPLRGRAPVRCGRARRAHGARARRRRPTSVCSAALTT